MSQSECTLTFSPLFTDRTIQPAAAEGVGWWDGGMPPSPHRSEQTGQPRPVRSCPFPPVSECPRSTHESTPRIVPKSSMVTRQIPWREIWRYARNQYRLSDLSRPLAGAATPVHHYHRHLYPIDLRLGRRSGNDHIWRAPFSKGSTALRSQKEHSMPQILAASDPCSALCVLWNVTGRGPFAASQSEG